MTRLPRLRARAERLQTRNAAVIFTDVLTFSLGAQQWPGAYSVRSPDRGSWGQGQAQLSTDPLSASLRLLKVPPGQPEPEIGATAPYQGGTLVLAAWSDTSAYTGGRVGVCRLIDERLRPGLAAIGNQLESFTPAEFRVIFAQLGQDLILIRPAVPSARWGASGKSPGVQTPVRGLLLPASESAQRVAAGAGLPVPRLELYLPRSAELDTPGWHVQDPVTGDHVYPLADARALSGQGIWTVPVGAPSEVGRGEASP